MDAWTYFRWAALILGVAAIITKPVFFTLLEGRWRRWLLDHNLQSDERPGWVVPLAVTASALTLYTWFRVSSDAVDYAWLLALVMTLILLRLAYLLSNYGDFRAWVLSVFNDRERQNRMVVEVMAFGVVLVAAAFGVY